MKRPLDVAMLKVSAIFFIGGLGVLLIAFVLLIAAAGQRERAEAALLQRCTEPAEAE